MSADETQKKKSLLQLRVSALEADLAYFAARLELIGEPESPHQKAQTKAFRALEEALRDILGRLRRSADRTGNKANSNKRRQ